jgi:hypothetical protein
LLLGFDVLTGREVWRNGRSTPFGDGPFGFASLLSRGFGAGDGIFVTPARGELFAWAPSTVRVTGDVEGATRSTSARFELEGGGAPLACRLDGDGGSGVFAPCSTPLVLNDLGEGEHALHVRLAAGGPAIVRRWIVDHRPPRVVLDTAAEGALPVTAGRFVLSVQEDSDLRCHFDALPWRDCLPTEIAETSVSGSHSFEVVATDRAGNVSAVERRSWIVVQGDAPVIEPTAALTRASSADFSFRVFGRGRLRVPARRPAVRFLRLARRL